MNPQQSNGKLYVYVINSIFVGIAEPKLYNTNEIKSTSRYRRNQQNCVIQGCVYTDVVFNAKRDHA